MLTGKNIVVTGGNRGIGEKIVEKCAREHANIWLCCRNINDAVKNMAYKIANDNDVEIFLIQLNLADESSIRAACSEILSYKLPIDGIVNNAGITGSVQLFSMTSLNDMRSTFEVNFFGPMFFTQRLLKNMLRQKRGSIVNMASVAAIDGEPAQFAYVSSKAAMVGATKKLSSELGNVGIRVNAVAPGMIDTDMGEQIENEKKAEMLIGTAIKRLGTTEEVADMVVYLLSDKASYVTGQVIRIDGGKI
jgi:3-oxoacyl-[acyl-carrier protein] reductase